ncbi:MAG: glycosyltransferase family 4 protein [Actinobacteria bacterium]|nr:glycosyltransferase family 4 protein [Actinomycetota bacterium]
MADDHAGFVAVSHTGNRSGAPILLLRFLDWLAENSPIEPDVLLLHGGALEWEFGRFGSKVLGRGDSKLWMMQRGLTNLKFGRAANAMAFARQAPVMWSKRDSSLILLNSLGALPVLRFLPETSTAKVVLYVHELDDSFDRTLGAAAWKLLSPRVDHFLTCGDLVTEMLVERKGIHPDRVSEQPGFVDRPREASMGTRHRRRMLGIPESSMIIGGSGRPEWRKGPELFIRMARTLVNRRPDLDPHFVWMGGPIDESPGFKMLHDINAAGLGGRFHLLGEVDDPTSVYSLLDVFALTSREDPFPLVMLEASSVGTPVVSFANGGVVEFASQGSDGPAATIVPYLDVAAMVDALIELADDPVARKALGERARDLVLTEYVTDVCGPRLLETLREVAPDLPKAFERRPDLDES